MTLKILVFIFMVLGFSQVSFAENVCVKNSKELESKKESFPKFFHEKKEVSFAHTEKRPIAMRFQVTEDKIIAQYALKYVVTIPYVGHATEICYDKDTQELSLMMDNEQKVTVKVTNDDPPNATVVVRGHTLTRSSDVYDKAVKILGGFDKTLKQTYAEEKKGVQ